MTPGHNYLLVRADDPEAEEKEGKVIFVGRVSGEAGFRPGDRVKFRKHEKANLAVGDVRFLAVDWRDVIR